MNFRSIENKRKAGNQRAFTLIEILIYIALLVVILVGVVNAIAMLSSSYRNVSVAKSIEGSAINLIDRIVRETRNAESIDAANSSFGVTPGTLSLNTFDASDNPMTVRFSVSNGRVILTENGISLGPITSSNVAVTSLIFRSFSTTTSSAVKIELTLESASTSPVYFSRNFYGTAVLRGSY